MRKLLIFCLSFFTFFQSIAQKNYPDRLKVFVDCQNGCDLTFIRSEINIVDFLLDRQAADVHILITDQNTGSGGDEYQLIFFGQNQFNGIKDTLHFINDANNTDFEERALLLKYLKIGLTPFIARTKMGIELDIKMKTDKTTDTTNKTNLPTKDPWNYWVFRIQSFGNINLDEVYKETSFNGSLSASRVTEDIKLAFEFSAGKNKSKFEYEDDNGNIEKFINRNNRYELSHYLVKSLTDHWSWGYELTASRNTFSNNKFRSLLRAGFEYNIFPYKLVNTKSLTFSYVIDARRNKYIDTTLYDKTKETLFGHALKGRLRVNQKWGTMFIGTEFHNYFNNWEFLNWQTEVELDIRITGGLTFFVFSSASLVRDQIYLPKEGATAQEVLTRRRQLASGYNFFTHFGISYRFGSKLNNFVNPRFD